MFTGDSEYDQLIRTFQKLGTPTREEWPLLPSLPDYTDRFPSFRPREWAHLAPALGAAGQDLLSRMLVYDPTHRLSATEALAHPYFADLYDAAPAPPPPAPAGSGMAVDSSAAPGR